MEFGQTLAQIFFVFLYRLYLSIFTKKYWIILRKNTILWLRIPLGKGILHQIYKQIHLKSEKNKIKCCSCLLSSNEVDLVVFPLSPRLVCSFKAILPSIPPWGWVWFSVAKHDHACICVSPWTQRGHSILVSNRPSLFTHPKRKFAGKSLKFKDMLPCCE